jgi:hypothetical protein
MRDRDSWAAGSSARWVVAGVAACCLAAAAVALAATVAQQNSGDWGLAAWTSAPLVGLAVIAVGARYAPAWVSYCLLATGLVIGVWAVVESGPLRDVVRGVPPHFQGVAPMWEMFLPCLAWPVVGVVAGLVWVSARRYQRQLRDSRRRAEPGAAPDPAA